MEYPSESLMNISSHRQSKHQMRPASGYKTTELEVISEETHKINLLTAAPINHATPALGLSKWLKKLRMFCGEEAVHTDFFS